MTVTKSIDEDGVRGFDRRTLLGRGLLAGAAAAAAGAVVGSTPAGAATLVGSGGGDSGTGALQPLVNVAAQGGVPGDDPALAETNQAAIEAAVALAQTHGAAVYLPPGTWMHTRAIKLPSNSVFFGAGMGVSVLKLEPMAANHVGQFENANAAGNTNIRIADLTIDGNKGEQAVFINENGDTINDVDIHGGFFQNVTTIRLDNIEVTDTRCNGLVFFTGCSDILVRNYRAIRTGHDGIYCGSAAHDGQNHRNRDFVLDGFFINLGFSADVDPSMRGVHGVDVFDTDGVVITNGIIKNATGTSTGAASAGVCVDSCKDFRVANVLTIACRRGFGVYNGQHSTEQVRSGSFTNCIARGSTEQGFRVENGQHLSFTSCVANESAQQGFWFVTVTGNRPSRTERLSLSACQSRLSGQHGFHFSGCHDVTLSSCVAADNSGAATGTASGFRFEDGSGTNNTECARVLLSSCLAVCDDSSAPRHKYGFEFKSPPAPGPVRLVGCYSQGETTADYLSAGTDFTWL